MKKRAGFVSFILGLTLAFGLAMPSTAALPSDLDEELKVAFDDGSFFVLESIEELEPFNLTSAEAPTPSAGANISSASAFDVEVTYTDYEIVKADAALEAAIQSGAVRSRASGSDFYVFGMELMMGTEQYRVLADSHPDHNVDAVLALMP